MKILKITAEQIIDKLANGQFEADEVTKKYSELKVADYLEAATRMIDFVEEAINSGMLAQAKFNIEGQTPVTFALETNIVNLPFSNYKKINSFFEEGQEAELNVYFEIASDYINVSRFRIDQFATSTELTENKSAFVDVLVDLMREKVDFVKENAVTMKALEKERAEAEKVAAANKKAEAKKKTTKKTTKKATAKSTTKKSATKKTTKKATTKK